MDLSRYLATVPLPSNREELKNLSSDQLYELAPVILFSFMLTTCLLFAVTIVALPNNEKKW